MDDLWQQFHRLPKAIRDAVARPEALTAVDSLEQRYPNLDLASFIMRAVVKEFPISEMRARLQDEFQLKEVEADNVATELSASVFSTIPEYLGVTTSPKPAMPMAPAPASTPVAPLPSPVVPEAAVPPPPPVNLPMVDPEPSVPTMPSPIVKPMSVPVPTPVAPVAPIVATPPLPTPTPAKPTGPVAPTQAYSDDDAAEIAQQTRKLQDMATPVAASLDDIAQEIITQQHLAFHDELLRKRAIAILKARLKDIRGKDDTLMMLVRGPKVGGLGLDQDIARGVVEALERRAGQVKERGMVRAPEPITPPPPPVMPPMSAQRPEPRPPFFRDAASAPVRAGMPPLPNVPTTPVAPAAPKPGPTIKRPSDIPLPKAMPPAALTPRPAAPSVAPTMHRERTIDRPAIADITRPVKMLGPAEEMRTMTLMEFRRLGQGANESTKRLLEKFKQLQSESFTMWSEAINGWRQSEVYQLYLAMGRQSMEQAMGITEVIKQRSAANQLYLSEHEFGALADLNRQLQS